MVDWAPINDRINQRYSAEIEFLAAEATRDRPLFLPDADDIYAYKDARMLGFLAPLIAQFGDGDWITVGDNGSDAWTLKQAGVRRITASSITPAYLRRLAHAGYLDQIEVRGLNAERLDLADGAVDILVCKEAFHHFPRAPLAFYEFLRVCRQGFVLIEPVDQQTRPLDFVRLFAKMILRRHGAVYEEFEPVGNFIFRISRRDVYRMLTALQVPWFAVLFFNNFIVRSLLSAPRRNRVAMMALRLGVAVQDLLSWMRLMTPGLAVIFVPTGATGADIRHLLAGAGFHIVTTPKNPYTTSSAG